MINNWKLQHDVDNPKFMQDDFDNYDCDMSHSVSIGDSIESDANDYPQYGVVVGIIRNYMGAPVCYKVWRSDDTFLGFDYISADKVSLCEPCGSADWALKQAGYKWIEDGDNGYYYNPDNEDVVTW